MECSIAEPTLDAVEAAVSSESFMGPGREAGHRFQCLLCLILLRLLSRDMNFLVAFLCLAERSSWQLAPLVGHEAAALTEHKVLQVQYLTRAKLDRRNPLPTDRRNPDDRRTLYQQRDRDFTN